MLLLFTPKNLFLRPLFIRIILVPILQLPHLQKMQVFPIELHQPLLYSIEYLHERRIVRIVVVSKWLVLGNLGEETANSKANSEYRSTQPPPLPPRAVLQPSKPIHPIVIYISPLILNLRQTMKPKLLFAQPKYPIECRLG